MYHSHSTFNSVKDTICFQGNDEHEYSENAEQSKLEFRPNFAIYTSQIIG